MSVALYKLTEKFPKNEIYGLTSQIRRAEFEIVEGFSEEIGIMLLSLMRNL